MVLLAASICTKSGKALLSRQFVEMTKPRIEGLIATFPKLISEGKQHTFIETDSVRYVYQPLEKLYVLLITTKASNILEDLETLRLFARVIPEYACGTDETSILIHAFQLIFAFDEIVALGYREDVTINQIRTFTEMDSHEERVFRAVQESKERETKEYMKKRARDITLARIKADKRDVSGFGSDKPRVVVGLDRPFELNRPPTGHHSATREAMPVGGRGGGGGMKLGGARKGRDGLVDNFVDKLRSEGVDVVAEDVSVGGSSSSGVPKRGVGGGGVLTAGVQRTAVNAKKEDLHFRIEEKMTVQVTRDGGVDNIELQGIMHALALSPIATGARVRVDTCKATSPANDHQPAAQIQTHPHLDKKAFLSSSWLQVKPGGKPFPENQEIGVLRWRLQTQEESMLPFSLNCWPNPIGGGFELSIEYELIRTVCEFYQVVVSIPLPPGAKSPVVGNCDGEYETGSRRGYLEWHLPVINADSPAGSIEFTVGMDQAASTSVNNFFPLSVSFQSDRSFFDISVVEATGDHDEPIPFSVETRLYAEKYEIV